MFVLYIKLYGHLSGKTLFTRMYFFNAGTCFFCSDFVPLGNKDTVFYTINFIITK